MIGSIRQFLISLTEDESTHFTRSLNRKKETRLGNSYQRAFQLEQAPPFFAVLGIEPWALYILGKNATIGFLSGSAVPHTLLSYTAPG